MIYLVTNNQELFNNRENGIERATVLESLDYLYKLDSVAFDTETQGFDVYTKDLISAQLGDAERQYVVDCTTIDMQHYKELLESREILMQNAKFDLRFLYHQRIVPTKIYDTYLAERILTCGLKDARKGLDFLVWKYCKQEMDKTVRGVIHKEGLSTRVIQYAAKDVEFLHEIQRKQLAKATEQGLLNTFSLDNEYVKVLAYIEYSGMKLDVDAWKDKMKDDNNNFNRLKAELDAFIINNKMDKYIESQLDLFSTGLRCNINWASSHQVIPLLKELGVDTKVKDPKTGMIKDSADAKVVVKYKDNSPLIPIYLDYKAAEKIITTYGQNFLDYINPVSGRIHTSYNQIMNTGRLSSGQKGNPSRGIAQMPNMQNIPSDERTRHCFVAEEGNVLIVSDYSGQESVVFANKCLDPKILEFYNKGLSDMHSFIAQKIYPELEGLTLEEIKKQHKSKRQAAKGAGFAIQYGGNGMTIADNLNISREEGEAVYDAYFTAFTGVRKYFKRVATSAAKNGYIYFNEISQRKCYIDFFEEFKTVRDKVNEEGFWDMYRKEKKLDSDIFKYDLKPTVRDYFRMQGKITRNSYNYPIQGTSADITKYAGIKMFNFLVEENMLFEVWMPNVVHDEILLECPEAYAKRLGQQLQQFMEQAGDKFCKTIPLKAEPCVTLKWNH